MSENIEVFVNDVKISLFRGAKVKHALIAYDQNVYTAALAGNLRVLDGNGFILGLDGGLTQGARIIVKPIVTS
ncbi:MAG: hypothetical protein AB9866_28380 [Syntrophobacteraceae bacterium]